MKNLVRYIPGSIPGPSSIMSRDKAQERLEHEKELIRERIKSGELTADECIVWPRFEPERKRLRP